MFIEVLFIILKEYKQIRCPSTDKWINNVVIRAMEYYLAIQRNGVPIHDVTWIKTVC
jgi:hypothetical protein